MLKLEIALGEAYYNHGYINIGVKYGDLLPSHNTEISVDLGNEFYLTAKINRTTNENNTPRIYIGNDYIKWVQQNFNLGDIMTVDILSPRHIRLNPPII